MKKCQIINGQNYQVLDTVDSRYLQLFIVKVLDLGMGIPSSILTQFQLEVKESISSLNKLSGSLDHFDYLSSQS